MPSLIATRAPVTSLGILLLAMSGCPPEPRPNPSQDAGTGEETSDSPGQDLPVWRAGESVGFRLEQMTCGAGCNTATYQVMEPTSAQVAALQRQRLVPATAMCAADGWSATLIILDSDSVRRTFRWRHGNDTCLGPWLLEDGAYQALKATVPDCYQSTGVPRDGCLRNVPFARPEALALPVQAGERWRIFLQDCDQPTILRLKAPTGGAVIGMGPPSGSNCSQIEHSFAAGGVYLVEWEQRDGGWGLLGAVRLAP